MARWLFLPLGPLGFVAGVLVGGLAVAQSVKLNGRLAQPGSGDVTDYVFSPDGARAVYRADQDADERFELYSAPSDGSAAPVKLSGELGADGDVLAFAVGGTRAIYRADAVVDGRVELYGVPLDGSSAALLLSSAANSSDGVTNAWLSPDGTRALFSAFDAGARIERLFSVPTDGSQAAQVIASAGPGHVSYESFFGALAFTPDGARAIFVTYTNDASELQHLRSVRVDGSQARTLDAGTQPFDSPMRFALSQDGSRVAFVEGIAFFTLVYAVAPDGTQRVQLGGGSAVDEFFITPDGGRVVFQENGTDIVSIADDGTQRVLLGHGSDVGLAPDGSRVVFAQNGTLRSTPVDAAVPVVLAASGAASFQISADSSRVAYAANEAGFRALRSVPIDGGTALLLNGPAVAGRGLALSEPSFRLAAQRALYREDRDFDEAFELFAAPLDGSQPELRIGAALSGARDVQSFVASPSGQKVLHLADQNADEVFELFGVPANGSTAPELVNAPLSSGPVRGDVTAFVPARGAGRVVYRADEDQDEQFELSSARLDARGERRRLAGPSVGTGSVASDFAVSADGEEAVFVADPSSAKVYSVQTGGGVPPVVLDSTNLVAGPFAFGAGDERVVYRRHFATGTHELRSVPVDGSAPAISLHPSFPAQDRDVTDFRLDPSGHLAVFRADHDLAGVFELYAAPIDGSVPARKLDADLGASADVTTFAITPDGAHVVYLADPALDEQFALFDAALDGSTPPERLSGPLAPGGDVTSFVAAPGGRHVVYRADARDGVDFELFRATIDGGPPHADRAGTRRTSVVLLTPMPAGESVQTEFALSADGTEVLFRARLGGAALELWRVPADGSSPPVRLNDALVAGGDVLEFALTPDGARVVYRADGRVDGVIELFSVALAGGPAVALDSLPAFADVESFHLAPDSSFVAYRADRETDGVLELYGVPLDGSARPRKLSGPMATGGDVVSDVVALKGGRALYRADQDADTVVELFEGFLGHALPAPPRVP